MKNILKYTKIITFTLLISAIFITKVSAAGGYEHPPEETAIAGLNDQVSIAIGTLVYTAGAILMASSKIIKSQINNR